jgi:hypothetical protein
MAIISLRPKCNNKAHIRPYKKYWPIFKNGVKKTPLKTNPPSRPGKPGKT